MERFNVEACEKGLGGSGENGWFDEDAVEVNGMSVLYI